MKTSTQVVTGAVRLSYLHVFEPHAMQEGQPKKYSATLLIPKTDKETIKAIKAACEAARVGCTSVTGKARARLIDPILDGDGTMPKGGDWGPECEGMWVIRSSSQQKPGLVDRRCKTIVDSTELYSGCWAYVDINFYAYNTNGNIGISCGLNNIQKLRDDEALGGRARAQDIFKPVEDDDDDELGL